MFYRIYVFYNSSLGVFDPKSVSDFTSMTIILLEKRECFYLDYIGLCVYVSQTTRSNDLIFREFKRMYNSDNVYTTS